MNQNEQAWGRSPVASMAENTAARVQESVYLLPRQPPRFFGRKTELENLKQSLKSYGSVTISGIAGVGKTPIALHFAHQALSEYIVILWMRSDGTTSLDQGCQESLRGLGLTEEAEEPGVESRRKWREHLSQAGRRTRACIWHGTRGPNLDSAMGRSKFGKSLDTINLIGANDLCAYRT